MTNELDGAVVVLTGATGGIGRATAALLAERGAQVVAVDLDADAAAEVAATVGGIPAPADVSTPAGVAGYVEVAMKAHGRIDILVNCAGIEHLNAIVETDPDEFDQHWAVNVRSVFLGLRAVLPLMYAQKAGAVVNTASVNGFFANPGTAGYTSSKHAVVGLTKVAALEAGPFGVRVNAIAPGPIDTPMLHRFATDEQIAEMARTHVPLGRVGRPSEVAELIAFLASSRASYISGETVRVDAGLLSGRAI